VLGQFSLTCEGHLPFIIVIVVASITFGTEATLCRAYKPQVLTLSKEQAERVKR